jgi:hypothetical protein
MIIGVTNLQFPKYVAEAITFTKTKPIPPLRMKREVR